MLKWLKILVLLMIVGVAGAVVAWLISSTRLTEYARRTIEREVGRALDQPVRLRQLTISLVPLRIEAAGFGVGEKDEILHFDELTLRILPGSSLKQFRPVGEAAITGLRVDLSKLTSESKGAEEEDEGDVGRFPFRLRDLRLTDSRVLIPAGDVPFELSTASLVASGGLSSISRRFSLQVDGDLAVRRGADRLEVRELHLTGAEARDGLVVQHLELFGDDVQLTAQLEERDPPQHAVSATLELVRLGLVDPGLDRLSGDLQTTATLTGSLADPNATAQVRVNELAVDGRILGDLDGRFTRTGDSIELASTRLKGLGGEADVQGQLTFSDRQPIRFAVDWRDLDVASLAQLLGEDAPASLSASGSIDGSGTLEPLFVSANGSGRLSRGQVAPLEWTLDGRYENGAGQAELGVAQTQANTIRTDVTIAADEALGGDIRIELGEVAALARLIGREEKLPFSGRFRASAAMSGSLDAPVVEGHLEATQLVAFGEAIGRMKGDFFADRRQARSDGLVIDFGDGRIEASGTIGFDAQVTNDWQATIRDARIDRLAGLVRNVAGVALPVSGGRISVRAKGRGPWSQVAATANLQARSFALVDEPFESLTIEVGTSWPRWNVEAAMIHAGEEHLAATIRGRGTREIVEASVDSTWWSLDGLRLGGLAEGRGQVRVNGAVRGNIASLNGQLKVAGRDLSWSARKIGDVVVDAQATNGKWQLSSDLLANTLRLTGALDSRSGGFRLDATWQGAELGALLGDRPGVQIATSGSLQLKGDLRDPLALGGEALVPQLLIRSGTLQLETAEPIRARADRGRVTIEPFTLAGSGTSLRLDGSLSTGGELHLQGEGTGDLQLLELVGEPLQSVEGNFEVAVNVDRRAGGDVLLSGTVSVVDTAVDVGLPIGVTDTEGRFALQGSLVRIDRLTGRLGGGTFSVDGSLDLEAGPDLAWKVVDVGGSLVPSLEQELSGKGTLRGDWNALTVAGEVEILRLLYDRNIEPKDFIPSFKRRLAPASGAPATNVVRLDLRVFAPDDLHIDNNFARLEAMADLRVRGTTDRPKLAGRIDVVTGEVFFRGRTFDVVTGVVDFRPQLGLVADLNITAETVVDTADASYGITVQISGTTEDPKVVLSADDPGLTQTDIVSLITFGKTVAQLQQGSGGSSMDVLVGFATGRVTKGVESGAESFLRVDRVEIEPTFSSTTGAFEPQVKLSKDFGDELTASVATTLGVDLQRALNLEYRLTDRTSLLGTWESESEGQAGAFGGGVKFRREFRRIPGFSLLGTTGK